MRIHSKFFILLSFFMTFHFSGTDKASTGRRLLSTLPDFPTIPTLPFPPFPFIPGESCCDCCHNHMLLIVPDASNIANAVVYYINWDFNIKDWPSGKTFNEGDTLVFIYNTDLHNVVQINETDYQDYLNCVVTDKAKLFSSGHDAIRLQGGANYFICGTMGHCTAGMQIAVVTT